MANSSENSLNAHNPNPTANPTTEVESAPVITVEGLRTIIRDLIQELKPSAEPIKIVLPEFNPEIPGADPFAWSVFADLLMKNHPLQGNSLIFALSSALKGSAAHWLMQIVTDKELTWPAFKELFTMRFGGKNTVTLTLMHIFKEQPQEGENIAAFAIRIRCLLKMRCQNATIEEIINAIVLCRMSSQDQRIEQIALEKDIQTEDQFLSEMKALACAKRPASPTSNTSTGPEAKRHKLPDSRNKCLY